MRWSGGILATALVLSAGTVAEAHELRCRKTVNGMGAVAVDDYPAKLHYELTVINVHPTDPSVALAVGDPLLEARGISFSPAAPFTLPIGGSVTSSGDLWVQSEADCLAFAKLDGEEDAYVDNTFYVTWDDGTERCEARVVCLPQKPKCPAELDDHNPCTVDRCDEQTGAVTHLPAPMGTSCADGNACNGSEVCDASGTCQHGTPPYVDDQNPCTADRCDETLGVLHTPMVAGTSCGDHDACNGDEVCDANGQCWAGSAPDLDDHNPCTTDVCDAYLGVTHVPVFPGTSCSDGNACNGAELCDAFGSCQPGDRPSVDDSNPCTIDFCDAFLGVTHVPVPSGIGCGDGNACNGEELCDGTGMCRPGTPPSIDDQNPCTADACDRFLGVTHIPVPMGTSCSDGNACDGEEICDFAGHCMPGLPPMVDDQNPCTADACDASAGVIHTPVAAGTSCADQDACNGVERCDGEGQCRPGMAPSVDDQNPCTVDLCTPSGVTHTPVAAGTSCDDGDACNGTETCDANGQCRPGSAPVNDQRCIFATRTVGFWKTHIDALTQCLAGPIDPRFGILGISTSNTQQAVTDALGILWASVPRFEDGTSRNSLEQKRIILAKQLVAGLCNIDTFGGTSSAVTDGLAAYPGRNCVLLTTIEPQVDAFNNSHDAVPFPNGFNPGPATPQDAQDRANDPTSPSGESCQ